MNAILITRCGCTRLISVCSGMPFIVIPLVNNNQIACENEIQVSMVAAPTKRVFRLVDNYGQYYTYLEEELICK